MTLSVITGTLSNEFEFRDPWGEFEKLVSQGYFIKQYWTGTRWLPSTKKKVYTWNGKRGQIIQTTGSGKTILEIIMAYEANQKGIKTGGKEEISEKSGKPYKAYFIQIENGLFHKDLKMFESELLALFLHTPKGLQNFQGSIFKVDKFNKLGLSYQGTAAQDINGKPIGAPRAPASGLAEPSPHKDQKELFIETMVSNMESIEGVGMEIKADMLTKICDKISPGNALQMIAAAKDKGMIVESKGIFKVVK